MKTAKKSNPQPFFSPKSRKWRKKSIARQHLHVPRSCRRRLAILQQLSLKQDDLEWPPLLPGCGTQHPLRALGGTRVLLAAAPTTPPCFRRWRRSSSLHSAHIQRNWIFIRDSEKPAGFSESPFHGRGRKGKRHLQCRFLRKCGAAGGRLLPLGGAVAQRLRGFKSAEPEKTVKRSSRRTGVNLQFFPV